MTTLVYKLGLRRPPGFKLQELEPVTGQLKKVWAFRQDLVSIEHEHEAAMKAVWTSVPAIAAVEDELAAAEEQARDLLEQARQEHSRQRALGTSSELATQIKTIRAGASSLRQQRRNLIAAAAKAKEQEIAALKQKRLTAISACQKKHARAKLYWGSYLAATTDHNVAVQAVDKRRAQNLPARLHHRSYDGTGTIAVQLQREYGVTPQERELIARHMTEGMRPGQIAIALADAGYRPREARSVALMMKGIAAGPGPEERALITEYATAGLKPAQINKRLARDGKEKLSAAVITRIATTTKSDPPRTPELIASGEGKWRNVFRLSPWMPPEQFDALPRSERRRIARTGQAVIAVGEDQTVTLPVSVHRMIPADAEIVEASLTVTRLAGQWDAALNVTVKIPDPPAPARGAPAVALHCGWRQRGDGSVRVGVWSSPENLDVPAHLAQVLIPAGSGRSGEIIIPAGWMDQAGYAPAARGIRDTLLNPVREKLAAWLDTTSQGEGEGEHSGADIRRWRSPARFASLALHWRNDPPQEEGGEEIAAILEEWRVRDRHIWEAEAHDRDQLTRRRDNAWRRVSAWLGDHADLLVTDDTDYAALRRRGDDADDDPVLPGVVQEKARARAALSAPGRLRQMAVQAAQRRGIPVQEVEAGFLTRTCPACSVTGDAHPRYAASAQVICPACGHCYDQDFSAAALMLARASGEGTPRASGTVLPGTGARVRVSGPATD